MATDESPLHSDSEKPDVLTEVGDGESLDALNTGSLFKTEEKAETDTKKHFKLDYSQYAKQGLIILIVLAVLLILAAVLLFKPELDKSATAKPTSQVTKY